MTSIIKSRKAPARHSPFKPNDVEPLMHGKFTDPLFTQDGSARAKVALDRLETLWFNTGTLCNLACANCYIKSSPTNDALVYLSADEVAGFLDEIAAGGGGVREIGFTGGEPFMNPDLLAMLQDALRRGHQVLVLTNAMKPMRRHEGALLALQQTYGTALTLRVSIDHYSAAVHEAERGPDSWEPMLSGLRWLAEHCFTITAAGRHLAGEGEADARANYGALFASENILIDAASAAQLILFPEMDESADVPEISEACWGILGKNPQDVMCASSRMVVRRKGEDGPRVAACTLLPFDPGFDLGASLAEADRPVALNHPHCARFCVLGGASCSA